ncbi:MAG: MFS transporter [Actinomycetota bacterium]|nr:MFS transporter [Actinomycetota bacterium]
MSPVVTAARRTFSSLSVPNYRLYFFGQIVSMSGTWIQSVAQMWLVYQLTGSGVALGVVTALQFSRVLVAGMWGGIIADRFNKRKIIIGTQTAAAALALILGLLTLSGVVELWMVYLLALGLGAVSVIEVPTRQSFVIEMVGEDQLSNAIGLNSTVFTSARVIGPAIAGVLIAGVGIGWCFIINAISFVAVITSLLKMNPKDLHRTAPVERAKGQLREGLRYVWTTPILRTSLLMMAIIGTIAFNFRILLPVMASREFGGGAGTYGALSALMGIGTVLGALFAASRAKPTRKTLILSSIAYGVLILIAGVAPSLPLEMIALVPMGAAGIAFVATANSTLQLNADPAMRGRVMALYSVVFLGSTPIGSPLVGWIGETFGVRAGFFISGFACLLAAAYAIDVVRKERAVRAAEIDVLEREDTTDEFEAVTPDDVAPAGTGGTYPVRKLRAAVRVALRR